MEQPGCALWPSHALSWGRQSEQRAPQSSHQRQATQQPPTSPELLRSHRHSLNSGRSAQGDFRLSPAPVKTGAWFVHIRTDCRSSTTVLLVFTSSHDQTHKPSQGFYSSYTSSPKQRTSLLPALAFPPANKGSPCSFVRQASSRCTSRTHCCRREQLVTRAATRAQSTQTRSARQLRGRL